MDENERISQINFFAGHDSYSNRIAPTLTVNAYALNFAPTVPNRPVFLLILISQHHSDTTVTLTTNTPDYFQLAIDSHPSFTASLTFVPSPTGTYVHVQYFPHKTGVHKGQLLIQTDYDEQVVALTGRSSVLLPPVRAIRPSSYQSQQNPHGPVRIKQRIQLLAFILMVSLAYVGYTNRCVLFPALCPDNVSSPVVNQARNVLSAHTETKSVSARPGTAKLEQMNETSAKATTSANRLVTGRYATDGQVPGPSVRQQRSSGPTRRANPTFDDAPDARPTPPTEESDLERELNQNQHAAN